RPVRQDEQIFKIERAAFYCRNGSAMLAKYLALRLHVVMSGPARGAESLPVPAPASSPGVWLTSCLFNWFPGRSEPLPAPVADPSEPAKVPPPSSPLHT